MMSNYFQSQEYFEELCILLGVALLVLLTKLYAYCFVSGAYQQARVISHRTDPLSRVSTTPQAQSGRSQVARATGLDTYVIESRFVQLEEGKGGLSATQNHCNASSQTYNFPQKYAVINL